MCGTHKKNAPEFYSSLAKVLSLRFVGLLSNSQNSTQNDTGYFEAVMDCIHAVFGENNPVIKKALQAEGYLEKYEKRFGINYDEGKIRCAVCKESREPYEMTISDNLIAQGICESCYSKNPKKEKENTE